ncbi:MAG: sulfatase-like hydrolase/transferase [Kiritimatiellae bacterium]|nr:sulfatase-like hydrolase/transferase [Kiritimatiellia bacterium]
MTLKIMSWFCMVLFVAFGRAVSVQAVAAEVEVSHRPNILIVFTDDQGYADLACYGNTKHKTPRLDQLAQEGTRFTSFYAQHVCGPSRSALLTGRYPIRSMGWQMPASEITLAEKLQKVGYQTACIGKWDVSSRKAIIPRMPNAQGFDYYFGTLGANDSGRVAFHENNTAAGSTDDMGSLTRLYTEKAIDYLKNRRTADKPFLLYLSHTMMHEVIGASEAFKGKSAGSLYGDVVEEFDHETGRLLDVLDQTELLLGKRPQGARDNFYYVHAMRQGKWKYSKPRHCMYGYARDKTRAEVEELYDLEADIGETTNLAETHPEKVAELKALLESIKGDAEDLRGMTQIR